MIALYIGLALFVLVLGHFVAIYFIFLKFFGRVSLKQIDKSLKSTPYSKDYADEVIKIREELLSSNYEVKEITSFDGLKLTGYYFSNSSEKTIIMFHGFHSHPFNNFGYAIKYFFDRHYNVLAVNERAHGDSEGRFSTYGQKEKEDVLSWINEVSKDENIKSIYLYGISMGATSICYASENITDQKVKFLISESAFTSIDALTKHIVKSQHVPAFLFGGIMMFYARKFAGIKYHDRSTTDSLKNNKIPTIFVHGTKDIVAIEDFFKDNYNNCFSNKYQIIVNDAPHALCAMHDKDSYLDKLEAIIGG